MYIDIIVDSRVRDKSLYERPNEYTIKSQWNKENIQSVQVLNPDIPTKRPLINNISNTLIIIDFISNSHTIRIPNGDYQYNPRLLCEAINSQIKLAMEQDICAEFDENTDKFSITSNKDFAIIWDECEKLAKIMGFNPTVSSSEMNYLLGRSVVLPTYVYNFNNDAYVQLVIPQISSYPLCVITKGSAMCPKIPVNNYIDELTCCFMDENNVVYDFQNHDHIFLLRLEFSSPIQ